MTDAQQITALSLLLAFLELQGLSPKLADWTEERLSDNPPRLIRLRRLIAMFRAFGLPWDPESFTEGTFIDPKQPRYTTLLAKLADELPVGSREWATDYQLPGFFQMLLDYRIRVGGVLSYSSGVLEASGLFSHAHRKVQELNRVIRDNVAGIDDTLAALINPEGLSFSVGQLTRDYGYPDVDLFEIDLDWI
jgi:hypothetical protein